MNHDFPWRWEPVGLREIHQILRLRSKALGYDLDQNGPW